MWGGVEVTQSWFHPLLLLPPWSRLMLKQLHLAAVYPLLSSFYFHQLTACFFIGLIKWFLILSHALPQPLTTASWRGPTLQHIKGTDLSTLDRLLQFSLSSVLQCWTDGNVTSQVETAHPHKDTHTGKRKIIKRNVRFRKEQHLSRYHFSLNHSANACCYWCLCWLH